MPISVTREDLLAALRRFDSELRDSRQWRNWTSKLNHRYAIDHRTRLYPVKQVVSLATGITVSKLNGGITPGSANRVVEAIGFTVVSLADRRAKRQRTRQVPGGNKSGRQRYWVVSPNVNGTERNTGAWKTAIRRNSMLFMGWPPRSHAIGRKFASGMTPGDLVLIARRHNNQPDYVGVAVIGGPAGRPLPGRVLPGAYGSARRLSALKRISPPENVSLISVLRHRRALIQLHPDRQRAHQLVVSWMNQVFRNSTRTSSSWGQPRPYRRSPSRVREIRFSAQPQFGQLDYQVRTQAAVRRAERTEAQLVDAYSKWLKDRGRTLTRYSAGRMMCDACEEATSHLIEAKSSTKNEYIRMAVGQLMEYAYLARLKFKAPRLAILVPKRPNLSALRWLTPLKIHVIWRQGKRFRDNARGRFC